MQENIKFVDGTLIELGPYTTTTGNVTEWDYIRVEVKNGEDVFLPQSVGGERIASYMREALGQDVRLFYAAAEVSAGKMHGSILGIETASGKRYSTSDQLDQTIAIGRKILGRQTLQYRIMWAVAICFILTIVAFPLGLIVAAFSLKPYLVAKRMKKGLAVMPTSAQFTNFFRENSANFPRNEKLA